MNQHNQQPDESTLRPTLRREASEQYGQQEESFPMSDLPMDDLPRRGESMIGCPISEILAPLNRSIARAGYQPDPDLARQLAPSPVVVRVAEAERRCVVVAGVQDRFLDVDRLDPALQQERRRAIADLVVEVEDAKCIELTECQRRAIVDWLYRRPFTMKHFRAAADRVMSQTTYRSIATDVWAQVFGASAMSSGADQRLRMAAYEQGRIDEREAQRITAERFDPLALHSTVSSLRTIEELRGRLEEIHRLLADREQKLSELSQHNSGLIEENRLLVEERDLLRRRIRNHRSSTNNG